MIVTILMVLENKVLKVVVKVKMVEKSKVPNMVAQISIGPEVGNNGIFK
jgi:hypothetical protein